MTEINIAGTAAVVGPDDVLVITLPPLLSAMQSDETMSNLDEVIKDGPLAGRVLVVVHADMAVVKPVLSTPADPPLDGS